MAGQGQLADEEKAAYSGRHVVMVEDGRFGLAAYPREDPKGREREYLLYMLDELLTVSDEIFERYIHERIYVHAFVKRSDVWHGVVVEEDGGVRFVPLMSDYVGFIKTADRVWMKVADGGAWVHVGRHAVVVKDKMGVFRVFARPDVWLRPDKLMLAVIEEALDEFRGLEIGIMPVHGSVLRRGVMYSPIIYSEAVWWSELARLPALYTKHNWAVVGFETTEKDYAHFVRTAEDVVFVRMC